MTTTLMHIAGNAEFRMAADFIEHTAQHVFLTGKAGSGKTTFLNTIRKHTKKQMVVTAPTGVVAVNAGGITLHSLFQLPFEPFVPSEEGTRRLTYYLRMSSEKTTVLRTMEVLVIDEVNMLRADTLDAIDIVLRRVRNSGTPFGGVQIVYIGDLLQLPPVVKEEEKCLLRHYYNSPFFFHAHVMKRCPPVYIELKNVYRQHDPHFMDMLDKVRYSNLSDDDLHFLNSRYIPDFRLPEKEHYIMLTTHNSRAQRINAEKLDRLQGEGCSYAGILKGEFSEYSLPADLELVLKVGAQVMFLKNDTEEKCRYYNGQLAVVTRLTGDVVFVRMDKDDNEIAVKREKWSNLRYVYNKALHKVSEEETGSFIQFPLRVAWATTIHKSQGLTFDKVVVDVAMAFVPGQAYVALSRCHSLAGLVLSSLIKEETLQIDPHVRRFLLCELPLEVATALLEEGKLKFCRTKLLRAFDWLPLFQGLWDWRGLVQRKKLQTAPELLALITLLENALKGQQNIANRFLPKLAATIDNSMQTGDFTAIKSIVQRAVAYFHTALCREILDPLDNKIKKVRFDRKKRTCRKSMEHYRAVTAGFIDRLCNLEYGGFPLVEGLSVPPIPPVTMEEQKDENR